MYIKDLRLISIGPLGPPGKRGVGRTLSNPLDEFGQGSKLTMQRGPVAVQLVEIELEDGTTGYGQVGLFDGAASYVINNHLYHFVVGESVFDTTRLWECMYRATQSYGRRGLVVAAISAIDIALWDAKGKLLGQPIYNLIGGRMTQTIPVYASRLYASEDIDAVVREAVRYKSEGFRAMKLRFAYGPADGTYGIDRNVALVSAIHDAVGPEVSLMADVYMSWDLAYCLRILPRLSPYGIDWLEEPVGPDSLKAYAAVRRIAHEHGILIAGGEHEYTRWGIAEMIDKEAIDILQVDVNRCGGITEALRIWSLAEVAGIRVIPHAGQSHNYHLVTAHTNSSMAEYFPPPTDNPDRNEIFWSVWEGEPVAKDGHVTLSDRPGLGITPNWEIINSHRVEA